jgi:hypothetical protein
LGEGIDLSNFLHASESTILTFLSKHIAASKLKPFSKTKVNATYRTGLVVFGGDEFEVRCGGGGGELVVAVISGYGEAMGIWDVLYRFWCVVVMRGDDA